MSRPANGPTRCSSWSPSSSARSTRTPGAATTRSSAPARDTTSTPTAPTRRRAAPTTSPSTAAKPPGALRRSRNDPGGAGFAGDGRRPVHTVRARGMTLIEIGIAMAIAAGLLAMAIPAISNVTRVQLRQKTGQLAGGVRSLYGATALAGHSCRLVLDIDNEVYWSECAEGTVRLDRAGEQSAGGARRDTREEELLANIRTDSANEEEQVKLQLAQKSAF